MAYQDRNTESRPLAFDDTPVLELTARLVSLEILPVASGEEPRIEAANGRALEQGMPAVKIRYDAGRVCLDLGPPANQWAPWWKHGSFQLFAPPHLRARIHSHAGQIRIERLSGCDLDVSAGAGQISLRDVHGRLTLSADAGKITGERIGGTLDVEASMGSVRLEVDSLDVGRHRVHSSMGSVRLRLIEGLKVRIEAQTSMGSTRNRYPSVSDAETVLALETDLGSVRVNPWDGASLPGARGADDWRSRWGSEPWRGVAPPPPQAPHGWGSPVESAHGWQWSRGGPGSTVEKPVASPSMAIQVGRPAAVAGMPPSGDELERILRWVEQGKLSAGEADELIRAMEGR